METMLAAGLIQATCLPEGASGLLCVYWNWAFWIGVVLGLVGAVVGLLKK